MGSRSPSGRAPPDRWLAGRADGRTSRPLSVTRWPAGRTYNGGRRLRRGPTTRMVAAARGVRGPHRASHSRRVAVFRDVAGNRWDLSVSKQRRQQDVVIRRGGRSSSGGAHDAALRHHRSDPLLTRPPGQHVVDAPGLGTASAQPSVLFSSLLLHAGPNVRPAPSPDFSNGRHNTKPGAAVSSRTVSIAIVPSRERH